MIKVNRLNKYYNKGKNNEIHVINETSIELPSCGFVSFLGHSGSGKTTLLNVLGGLDKASGSIQYDEKTFSKYSMRQMDAFRSKHIGYVFQNYNLLLDETVYDNLKIALDIIGVTDSEEADRRIEYTLKAVGMYKFRKKKAYALSGGQQQRVGIARALVKNCKIIIADEPTGNLDSRNTIEVMNILKKISKDALVLMVTHEQSIARFYSDFLFEIQDGKIVKKEEMKEETTLKTDVGNVAYLKDMRLDWVQTPIGKINVYREDSPDLGVDLDIIIKNKTIYIQSNQPIKLVDNSNLKIVDDHYQVFVKEEIDEFNYDTSWYRDLKDSSHFFKRFWNALKMAFSNFRNVKRRVKLLYVALGCIGFVCAISVISLINASVTDTSSLEYNRNYSTLVDEKEYGRRTNEMILTAYEENAIDNVLCPINVWLSFSKKFTYHNELRYSSFAYCIPFQEDFVDLGIGRAPQNDSEICISRTDVDRIIQESDHKLDVHQMLGQTVQMESNSYTICGITEKDNHYVYTTLNAYCKIMNKQQGNPDYVLKEDYDLRYAKAEENLYRIVDGRDVDCDAAEPEVLVWQEKWDELTDLGSDFYIELDGTTYQVVGSYDYLFETEQMYILNRNVYFSGLYNEIDPSYISDADSYYRIVEGRDIENDNEILVSVYSEYGLNRVIGGRTVVGRITGAASLKGKVIGTLTASLLCSDYYMFIFRVVNPSLAERLFQENNYSVYDTYTAGIRIQNRYKTATAAVFRTLFIVLAVVSAVFIYLIMRSKMIADIYSIGIYRSLGASRLQMNRKFLLDVLILTTCTTLIGYFIAFLGYHCLVRFINDTFGITFLMKSSLLTVLGGLGLYAAMIFCGMLPMFLLLLKTPSEICSKYDI